MKNSVEDFVRQMLTSGSEKLSFEERFRLLEIMSRSERERREERLQKMEIKCREKNGKFPRKGRLAVEPAEEIDPVPLGQVVNNILESIQQEKVGEKKSDDGASS